MEISISVNGQTFACDVEDTPTGRAFIDLLPRTLNMNELNGNEKYVYTDTALPTNEQHHDTISPGDLMLFGNKCIVLFYGQAGGYSYTRIGRLKTTDGLAEAVGKGNANVSFAQ